MSIGKKEISNFILNTLRRVAHKDPSADPQVKGQREWIQESKRIQDGSTRAASGLQTRPGS